MELTKKPPRTSLAALESLSLPLVQEIVLSMDVRCADCHKRLANMMAKMRAIESLIVNVSEKNVTLVYRCPSATEESSYLRQFAGILYKNRKGKVDLVSMVGSSVKRSQIAQKCKS